MNSLTRLAAAGLMAALPQIAAAQDAICYNCPPEWADWASMIDAIEAGRHRDAA